MRDTTMIAKSFFAVLTVAVTALSVQSLRSEFTYRSYHDLAEAVGRGRLVAQDEAALVPFLTRSTVSGASAQRAQAVLQGYSVDLVAARKGVDPLSPSSDLDLQAARELSVERLRYVLSRRPSDGDLWLRFATVSWTLGGGEDVINSAINLSERTMPLEGWVKDRRESFFLRIQPAT